MGVAGSPRMADVATRLRNAREHAGVTIEHIAARTKIKPGALRAIERGEFDRLPGEFFARAFVRTYAQELRLPVAELMAEYEAQRPAPRVVRAENATHPDTGPGFDEFATTLRRLLPSGASATWTVGAIAIVLVAVAFAVNRTDRPTNADLRPVGTSGSTPVAAAVAAAPVPVESAPPAAAPAPAAAPSKLRVEIHPSRPLWITGHADGTRVLYRTIQPGERVVVEGGELSFRVGDAGAFEYTLNGVPGKPPGRSGEVREFRITRENYRAFVR
jgi:cytoskeleton protein RodZ